MSMENWIEGIAPNLKNTPYCNAAVDYIEAAKKIGKEP